MRVKYICACKVCDRLIKEDDIELSEEEFNNKLELDPDNTYTDLITGDNFWYGYVICEVCDNDDVVPEDDEFIDPNADDEE